MRQHWNFTFSLMMDPILIARVAERSLLLDYLNFCMWLELRALYWVLVAKKYIFECSLFSYSAEVHMQVWPARVLGRRTFHLSWFGSPWTCPHRWCESQYWPRCVFTCCRRRYFNWSGSSLLQRTNFHWRQIHFRKEVHCQKNKICEK